MEVSRGRKRGEGGRRDGEGREEEGGGREGGTGWEGEGRRGGGRDGWMDRRLDQKAVVTSAHGLIFQMEILFTVLR